MEQRSTTNKNTESQFELILQENNLAILRICRIYAQLPLTMEDLYQEVVIQIWEALPEFKETSSTSTWAYRIALNVCLKAQRSQKKESQRLRLESIELKLSESKDEEEELRFEALQSCMKALPESDRSLLVLYLEDLPYRKISEITGLGENHIAVKMKRIRTQLELCISPKLK